MQTEQVSIRQSDLVLKVTVDPLNNRQFCDAKIYPSDTDYLEYCGLIPDFFAEACLSLERHFFYHPEMTRKDTLEYIAEHMSEIAPSSGFQHRFEGTVSTEGVYGNMSEDPDLKPLAIYQFIFHVSGFGLNYIAPTKKNAFWRDPIKFECLVYEYGITAIRMPGVPAIIGRFD